MEMGLQKDVKTAGQKGKAGLVFRSGPRGRPRHPQAPACAIPPVCKQWKTKTVRAPATQDSHQGSPWTAPGSPTNLPPGSKSRKPATPNLPKGQTGSNWLQTYTGH